MFYLFVADNYLLLGISIDFLSVCEAVSDVFCDALFIISLPVKLSVDLLFYELLLFKVASSASVTYCLA